VADLDVDGWSAMVDVNLKGVLHGIAAALPVFRRQGSGHLVTVVSTSGLKIVPTQAVYAGTKNTEQLTRSRRRAPVRPLPFA
jgi:NADP-dependent 3-hydroxy acid dehydrogenase YdfG